MLDVFCGMLRSFSTHCEIVRHNYKFYRLLQLKTKSSLELFTHQAYITRQRCSCMHRLLIDGKTVARFDVALRSSAELQ